MNRKSSLIRVGKVGIDQAFANQLKRQFNLNGTYRNVFNSVFWEKYGFITKRYFHADEFLYFTDFEVKIRKRSDFKYLNENMVLQTIKATPNFFFYFKFTRKLMFTA
jgi:hypothetical protein